MGDSGYVLMKKRKSEESYAAPVNCDISKKLPRREHSNYFYNLTVINPKGTNSVTFLYC